MNKHIGIYSGSFDPIHRGHIAFASEALKVCGLREVIFLPEKTPREKPNVTEIKTRIESIKNEIIHIPGLSVLELDSPQFTIAETLPRLQGLFPNTHFTLLVGSDIVRTFEYRWQDLDILLNAVSLAIGMRKDDEEEEIESILGTLDKQHAVSISYTFIYTGHSHVASSHIR